MFNRKQENDRLPSVMDDVYDTLAGLEAETDEYDAALDRLERLQKLQDAKRPDLPSADTMLTVGGHLIGIILITRFEREHIITTKAFEFIRMFRR